MQDLYKQAIADAKALRASAIANAKAQLQETFAPQVEALVKQSLREDAEEKELEEAEEMGGHSGRKFGASGAYSKKLKIQSKKMKILKKTLIWKNLKNLKNLL